MSAITEVYLITGFLGSGKTTLLNRIIEAFPKDGKLMILMNEFGDIGVDGPLVDSDDLTLLEISKGSIFCVCVKTDFIRGLMEISQNIQPDVLIIEATGVANPSDLKRDLELSIFQNRFQFKEQFCMIDAGNFKDAYDTFTSIEKQIESSTVFVINKIDLVDAAVIQKVKQIVRTHHPDPEFYETVYAEMTLENYLPEKMRRETQVAGRSEPVSPQELDAFIDSLLANPGGSMTPPDRLLSVSFTWQGKARGEFEEMIKMLPDGIVRAKGIFSTHSGTYLFNHIMGSACIEKIAHRNSMTALMNKVVFIGPPEVIEDINAIDWDGAMQKE